MSTDQCELAQNPLQEELLVHLKNVKWDGIGRGKLSLTNKRITFEGKGHFFNSSHEEICMDISTISSMEINEPNNTLLLKWLNESNELMASRLHLPKGNEATHLCLCLDELLESLRHKTEREERMAHYQSYIWEMAYHVWILAGLLSRIVRELHRQDWDAVDASVNEVTEAVKAFTVSDESEMATAIQAVTETAHYRDAPALLRNVMAVIKATGTMLNDDFMHIQEWGECAMEAVAGLRWRDIRFIFLFAVRYELLALWRESGDTDKVNDSLTRLARLSSILADKVSNEVRIENSGELEAGSDAANLLDAAAKNLEASLKTYAGSD